VNPLQQDPTPAQALEIAWQCYQRSRSDLTGAEHQLVSKAFNILATALNPPASAGEPAKATTETHA